MKIRTIFSLLSMATLPLGAICQNSMDIGIETTNLNPNARPGDDFYQYACGGWIKRHPLPAAYSRFGCFDQLVQNNDKRVNDILKELLNATTPTDETSQKLGDFYKLAMDSVRRNNEGFAPIKPLLNEIGKAKTTDALHALQLKYSFFEYGIPFSDGFGADEKEASQNIMNVSQSGLTLGQKEYYLDKDEATIRIREDYKQFIIRMFSLSGLPEVAQQNMQYVMSIETELAKVSKSRTELRDVEANYNKMSLADFEQKYPELHLHKLLLAKGINEQHIKTIVVGQPDFMKGANELWKNLDANALRAYMQWHVLLSAANYLGDDSSTAYFDFFGKTMRGRKEDYPRWKRATNQIESQMGEALGRIYVAKYFPAEAKQRMEALVKNLQLSLAERIKEQTWMSSATKAAALDKLNSFYVKVGYPNKWTDLSALVIDPSKSYYENMLACRLFWEKKSINDKAGKPVDRDEWYMYPQTVNAYYNPTTNEICFPAGILQRPFFDMHADDAYNYGAIGVVIGHEMTHGFDDQGRHYDKNGNMTDWWTEQDANNFAQRADVYVRFFSNIKVLPDLNANGKLTLGENLADHGGLEVAYNAFKHATASKPLTTIGDFTPEQRFFIAYAGVWAGNITEEEIRSRTKSDPHSLGEWRVNGALPHINAWYKAFNIQPTDKMYLPENKRLKLW